MTYKTIYMLNGLSTSKSNEGVCGKVRLLTHNHEDSPGARAQRWRQGRSGGAARGRSSVSGAMRRRWLRREADGSGEVRRKPNGLLGIPGHGGDRSTGGGGVVGRAWQHELWSPGERVASLLLSPRLADLTITFPGRRSPVKAHRVILAMSSPVFEAELFEGAGTGLREIACEDPPEAFLWLLQHMYRGLLPLPDLHLTLQVTELAVKYQVAALVKQCTQFLRESVTPTTVFQIYNAATLLADGPLLRRCAQLVEECGSSLLVSSSVGQLDRPSLTHLLDHLPDSPHVLVFRCIIIWGQARLAERGVDPHHSQLREEVLEHLPRVGFLAMSVPEFVTHVMPSGVFTPEEDLAILLNIKGYQVALPDVCCATRTSDAEGKVHRSKGHRFHLSEASPSSNTCLHLSPPSP